LVEIFECLEFFWKLEKERIWSIIVNLWDFAWRLRGWMTASVSINFIGMKSMTVIFLNPDAIMTEICGSPEAHHSSFDDDYLM